MKKRDRLALMGQIATVHKRYERTKTSAGGGGEKVDWVATKVTRPWTGWIIGFRNLQVGKLEIYYGEEAVFTPSGVRKCVLVAPWPTMKGIPVPLDGFELGGVPMSPSAREAANWSRKTRERIATIMRKEMADRKRDEKGRWLPLEEE